MRNLFIASLVLSFAACGTTPTPPASAPASVASTAPTSAAPPTAAPATEPPPPPPKHECTVFVMGDPSTAYKATVENKQFKQKETTSTEIKMHTKTLAGDDMKRIALCDAFAKRKCPEAWRGDDTHCRMQMTVDAEADWGQATAVPKD